MLQTVMRHLRLALVAAALAATLSVLLVRLGPLSAGPGGVPAAAPTSSRPASLTSPPTVANGAPTPAPTTPNSDPGKSQPATPPTPAIGAVPYPQDAGPTVAEGQLKLQPSNLAAGRAALVQVTAPAQLWNPGQKIFIFVGHQYEATISGPGGATSIQVAGGLAGGPSLVVTGFQFPGNDEGAPVDGYGTATLGVTG